jgi:hypothetical protein
MMEMGETLTSLILVREKQRKRDVSLSFALWKRNGKFLAGITLHPWPLETLPKILGQRALPVRFKQRLAA